MLFNKSGTNVSAAAFDRNCHKISFIVDYTLYWASFSTQSEADYVTAVFNSSVANMAIKPFQSTGLLGERDVTKKLLELPIPTFDHNNVIHMEIAGLGTKARQQAEEALSSGHFPSGTSLARQRAFIRKHLELTISEIDKLVRKLLSASA